MSRPAKRQIQSALAFYAGEPMPETAAPRKNDRPEAAALAEVLKTLRHHSAVAWCERMNSGAHAVESPTGRRFIRYGFRGCPDVIGQLLDGRFLGVEVKAPGGKLGPEQAVFLERVTATGGVAFVARNAADVGSPSVKKRQKNGGSAIPAPSAQEQRP